MELIVNGYRAVDFAQLTIPEGEITILTGENGHGKSSLLECLHGITLADVEYFGKHKKQRDRKIHHGAVKSEITLKCKTGTRTMTLPKGDLYTPEGRGLNVGKFALGLVKLTKMSPDEVAGTLEKYLKSAPDRKRTTAEVAPLKTQLGEQVLTTLLDTIFGTEKMPAKGWAPAEEHCKTKATETKALFRQATGVNWGTSQGLTFFPSGWDPDLKDLSQEDLSKAVVTAREDLEKEIATNAVSERDREQLQSLAAQAEEFSAKLNDWTKLVVELENEPTEGEFTECSDCGLKGHVKAGKLVAADKAKQAQLQNAKRASELSQSNYNKAVEAKQQLASLGCTDGKAIDNARAAVARAEARLRAKQTKDKGTQMHHEIVAYLQAAELFSASGLRRRSLIAALEPFSQRLEKLCAAAGWSRVAIDNNLEISYNGEFYDECSTAEKYRIDATLQVALAQIEQSQLLTFDEAQQLDRPGRNGLMKILRAVKITAVVAMTCLVEKDGRRIIPNLGPLGLGVTYWLEKGKVYPFVENAKTAS